MLRNTAIALAAVASLMLGAGALTPALANYSQCDEQPNAESCPTYAAPTLNHTPRRGMPTTATHRHICLPKDWEARSQQLME